MLSITLLSVGSIKKSWCVSGCEEYIKRLNHSCNFKLIELPASKQKDPQQQKEEESRSIINYLEKTKGVVWVLDETGSELTSQKFADEIGAMFDRGEEVIFVLGGAYGLNGDVKARGDKVIALSKMTLPHELCRLFFVEQLYRAMQILKGSGYHH